MHFDTCAQAATLETLKWAHEHGAKWDAATAGTHAEMGRLELLKYAVDSGCARSRLGSGRTCNRTAGSYSD